jgi:hypothetical protein
VSSIYLHPDLVLNTGSSLTAPPWLYVHRTPDSAGGRRFDAIAALAAKTRLVRLIPGLPGTIRLRERKLIFNQVLGGEDPESLRALIRQLTMACANGDADCLFFEDVEVGSTLWDALADAKEQPGVTLLYPAEPQAHWWIRFPERSEDYWKAFSHRTRNTFRRRQKKFSHTITCFQGPNEAGAFLDKAHEVSKKSWQSQKLGLRIRNGPEERSYWETIAAHGAMRSYLLEHEGNPCAFMLASQWNGCFLPEEIAYDPAHAAFAAGTVLLLGILQDLLARDTPRLLDFGFGDNEYKRVFGNEQRMSGPVLLVRRSWKVNTALRVSRFCGKVATWASRRMRSVGILSWLRKKLLRG